MVIRTSHREETAVYAAEELKKYLNMIDELSKIESEIAPEFDLHLFDNSVKRKLK